jgi:formylglycine-generating enzyme required for sulfatase activity
LWEWCQSRYEQYPRGDKVVDDGEENPPEVTGVHSRVLRAGPISHVAPLVRAARRLGYAPAGRNVGLGLRPARTYY